MRPGFIAVEAAPIIGCVAVMAFYIRKSLRQGRFDTGLALAVAILLLAWMEGPYDYVLYAQFHPEFSRFPDWGPFGVTHGGLVAMAPPAYVAYFFPAALLSVRVGRRVSRRFGWSEAVALLASGLVVGYVYDLAVEIIGTALGLWRFGRGVPGLTLFGGSLNQVPLNMSMLTAVMSMLFAYLLGRRNDRGQDVVAAWVHRKHVSPVRAAVLSVTVVIAMTQLLFLAAWLPDAWIKATGSATVVVDEQLYDNVRNQPE